MNRSSMLKQSANRSIPWDMVIIGGGATGVGTAVDAASRGFDVLLLEQHDFGKGTSSRSTKLVHGGVRYLEQGNVSLVMEALKERGLLRQNAPHLVHDLPFILPNFDWWEAPFYGLGLKMYDMLAGKYGFGASRLLSKADLVERIPTIQTNGLRGGIMYYDGQFDDSRLLINLAATAAEQGATLINYMPVIRITKDSEGYINGVVAVDKDTGNEMTIHARVVINATGAFTDDVRRMADPAVTKMIAPSQGIHLVFDRSVMPGDAAIMVPHTTDGRVMFAIPWHQHVLVGTTDTAIDKPSLEPVPFEHEIQFILETAARYLNHSPSRNDVLSVFVGIRPLVKTGDKGNTAALSRDHTINIDPSGLLSIAGGKWTTYRKMAEDCVDHATMLAKLDERPCITKTLRIHGYLSDGKQSDPLSVYGSDAAKIRQLISQDATLAEQLHPALPYCRAEVLWSVREEMACTVEDFLSRRVRALFLNARAAGEMAPQVAEIMASELKKESSWKTEQIESFQALNRQYLVTSDVVASKRSG